MCPVIRARRSDFLFQNANVKRGVSERDNYQSRFKNDGSNRNQKHRVLRSGEIKVTEIDVACDLRAENAFCDWLVLLLLIAIPCCFPWIINRIKRSGKVLCK